MLFCDVTSKYSTQFYPFYPWVPSFCYCLTDSLCVCSITLLLLICIANIFSHSKAFTHVGGIWWTEVLNFNVVWFINFSFVVVFFCYTLKSLSILSLLETLLVPVKTFTFRGIWHEFLWTVWRGTTIHLYFPYKYTIYPEPLIEDHNIHLAYQYYFVLN